MHLHTSPLWGLAIVAAIMTSSRHWPAIIAGNTGSCKCGEMQRNADTRAEENLAFPDTDDVTEGTLGRGQLAVHQCQCAKTEN